MIVVFAMGICIGVGVGMFCCAKALQKPKRDIAKFAKFARKYNDL